MATQEIISKLPNLNEAQLLAVNAALVDQLKAVRRRKSAAARHMFKTGDRVGFGDVNRCGKQGYKEGDLVRVKRTRAEVRVGNTVWTVPLNMLQAV